MLTKVTKLIGAPLLLAALIPVSAFGAGEEQGKATYQQLCASCHGDSGAADGAVAKALPAGTVTNLRTATYKYATDDAKMKELIQKGGGAVGLSPMMPPQMGLDDATVTALVDYVKTLKE